MSCGITHDDVGSCKRSACGGDAAALGISMPFVVKQSTAW